jgi:tRNA (guanosine-2'-O-)-methyltransferase
MRRRSSGVARANELLGPELARTGGLDPERMIADLEPLVTPARRERLQAVIAARLQSVSVMMDAPHDPHNGAAVMRSCDAFGVQKLHVIERRGSFLVATSVARGAEKWVDVQLHRSEEALAAAVAEQGFEFVATDAEGELSPEDLKQIPRLMLVIGNERLGIAGELRRHCTRAVRVPMRGFVDSLNLSVSTAILLAAAVAGRPGDLPHAERRRLYARGLYLSASRAGEALLESTRDS